MQALMHVGRCTDSLSADDLGRDEGFERTLYYHAMSSDHKREGVAAFLEKRSPKW